MKTRGLEVHCGVLVVPWGTGAAPVQFWNRLKHRIAGAHLVDEYLAEYARESATVTALRETCLAPPAKRLEEHEREARMFRRWVERVCGPQQIWPWTTGWTEELVDSYLQADAPAAQEAA